LQELFSQFLCFLLLLANVIIDQPGVIKKILQHIGKWEESHAPPERDPPIKEITFDPSYSQLISSFISAETYDSCVEMGLQPDLRGSIFIGVDASVRRDSTACVCIRYDKTTDALLLADYKVWKPSPNQPINLEASVEFYLRRIYNQPGVYIERTPSFSDYANSSAANWKPSDNCFNPRDPSTWE